MITFEMGSAELLAQDKYNNLLEEAKTARMIAQLNCNSPGVIASVAGWVQGRAAAIRRWTMDKRANMGSNSQNNSGMNKPVAQGR